MAKKKSSNLIGSWAFLIGVVLAVILGFFGTLNPTMLWVLALIGLVVGLLNIADEEAEPFLISGIVLIIASALGAGVVANAGARLSGVLDALLVIFVPATIVVAIRNVFSLARR